ncbi:MAG TPA: hypothetical protein DCZ04_02285 [Syntrophorhabdus aromaticivorans]|nr:hypothetical protein [Syntrophorhabdus aromaticivorans]
MVGTNTQSDGAVENPTALPLLDRQLLGVFHHNLETFFNDYEGNRYKVKPGFDIGFPLVGKDAVVPSGPVLPREINYITETGAPKPAKFADDMLSSLSHMCIKVGEIQAETGILRAISEMQATTATAEGVAGAKKEAAQVKAVVRDIIQNEVIANVAFVNASHKTPADTQFFLSFLDGVNSMKLRNLAMKKTCEKLLDEGYSRMDAEYLLNSSGLPSIKAKFFRSRTSRVLSGFGINLANDYSRVWQAVRSTTGSGQGIMGAAEKTKLPPGRVRQVLGLILKAKGILDSLPPEEKKRLEAKIKEMRNEFGKEVLPLAAKHGLAVRIAGNVGDKVGLKVDTPRSGKDMAVEGPCGHDSQQDDIENPHSMGM